MRVFIFTAIGILFFTFSSALGQGIRGTVISDKGDTLAFASIYIVELKDGASANQSGKYEIKLKPGQYNVVVQYIGYQTATMPIQVADDWINQNFVLKEQTFVLREVEVKSRREDPAYTIMRKAIAKRKFHLLQYDSYEMKVYIKGTGQLTNAPFFLKNKLKEEGLNLDEAYTTESISVVKFTQPNTYDERVISVRTSGEGNENISPNSFINNSFYNDKIAESISPLSSAAFAYYRFGYEGSFRENGVEINRIKVTPRSRGEQVFEGYIYIIEDLWAIHSLDLKTSFLGFQIEAQQNYAPVEKDLWMPITHQYKFSGKILGFAGEYKYLASSKEYKVQLNQDLIAQQATIIDEKIEEVPEEVKAATPTVSAMSMDTLSNPDQMTRKQFRKMINEYEKEQLRSRDEPLVVSERSFKIDSLAAKRDSAYWASQRPVPLTEKELKGYQRDDSLAVIEKVELSGKDSAGVLPKRKFKPQEILFGGSYTLGPGKRLIINPTFAQIYFNTVEGLNVNYSMRYIQTFDSLRKSIEFKPTARYGFSSDDFYGKGELIYRFGGRSNRNSKRLSLEGGRFVSQYNSVIEPIHPHINTLSTLVFRQNFMKLYEKTYAQADFRYVVSDRFKFTANLEYAYRQELFNTNDYSFFYRDDREFTPNAPANLELLDTSFDPHNALVFQGTMSYRPLVRYRINNGVKTPIYDRSPELLLMYRKGINGVANSEVNYDHIELGLSHNFQFGISGKLDFELRAGTFLNDQSVYFMDFKHFDGNRTILSSLRPAGAFRLLDYYQYSTTDNYFAGHTHYQFRKFLFTQLPEIRFSGLRENIFFNYLKTQNLPDYAEVGYSVDNIFRLFRVEVAASFQDWKYQEVGLRIGIATFINISIGED
ncbi:DUF5686 and carboxypeptidase regulatory-like domain-containing protein [Penaeicola halotolerans]|uniref:DUF5686 and carboxypeptidase regulatory-like domain-containing protein n=1 Tax=Penaeicola halotolerans TaxID=2793196 RepID=UPI001CF8EFE4|nr:DUF5686 and carboxypeptidase regulatory-like domain-containing protein [Penaeicola halotolerans]